MTTPPTDAEVDAFFAANMADALQLVYEAGPSATLGAAYALGGWGVTDAVIWVAGYTDNAANKNYVLLSVQASESAGASDAQLEATCPVVSVGSGPGEFNSGSSPIVNVAGQLLLPYLYALQQAYGSINIRGYLVPAITAFLPVDSAVQGWVNDTANWATAG